MPTPSPQSLAPDSPPAAPSPRVVGTAGHVDHGKSTLIRALTGIDPDRLREEKERGMTIDLGFAWLELPSGVEVSIVDVPGHERFVHNMLAGVGGIDIALLVVAADEGIMPQTREHLDILDLLGIESGVVAITKTDLVDQEWLDLVTAEVEDALAETSLRGAPLVPVSATTGQGLDALVQALERLLARERQRPAVGHPRLPIDRVFTMAGFGTVVTGTLIDGELRVGGELEVQPGGRKTRVRGLQSHRKRVERAPAGTRVAVNVSGLSTEELARGDVLTAVHTLRPTRMLDVRLRLVKSVSRPLRHNAAISFHTGSAEIVGKVALLDEQELKPGESGWAQIRLDRPVAAAKADLFVIRLLSPAITVGGGAIVEPHPRRHRRFQERVLERLAVLERGTSEEIVLQQLQTREPTDLRDLTSRTGLAPGDLGMAVRALVDHQDLIVLGGDPVGAPRQVGAPSLPDRAPLQPQTLIVSRAGWERLVGQASETLGSYHRTYPLRQGMQREEVRTRLRLEPRLFVRVQERLVRDGVIEEAGPMLRLASHQVQFSPAQEQAVAPLLDELRRAGASPPTRADLETRPGMSPELLQALADRSDVIEVAADLVYHPEIYEGLVQRIVDEIRSGGSISVAQVRDLLDTSRRYALALMAHLDERRVTRRVGDERILM